MSVQTFTFIGLMVDKAWTLPSLRVQTHQNNLKESPHIASVLQKKLHLKTPQEYSPRPNAYQVAVVCICHSKRETGRLGLTII